MSHFYKKSVFLSAFLHKKIIIAKYLRMRQFVKIFLMVLCITPCALLSQVYQLPNPSFESWDSDGEPTGWNGFTSSNCTVSIGCSSAQTVRHEKSTSVVHSGTYSCKIFATKITILGIVVYANGNLTTGQIQIGSTTANNPNNNNTTIRQDPSLSQPFHAKPDSISFWVNFTSLDAAQCGRMTAIIHDDYNMSDPYSSSLAPHIVGLGYQEFQKANGWQHFVTPFNYNYASNSPQYILLTFTTNKNPGEGTDEDILYIDDVTMIYHAELRDLCSNGITVNGFNANTYDYYIELPYGSTLPTVTATKLSSNANMIIEQATIENPVATVTVSHGDQTKVYRIHYTIAALQSADLIDLQLDGTTISGFNPHLFNYNHLLLFGAEFPTVTATPRVDHAQVNIIQATTDNPTATVEVTCGDLQQTYTIDFLFMPEFTADLANLFVNNTSVAGFHPDTLNYEAYILFGSDYPEVSAIPVAPNATLSITQATIASPIATVEVTCGPESKTYSVTFTHSLIETPYLNDLRVNGELVPNFNSYRFDYQVTLPYNSGLPSVSATPIISATIVTMDSATEDHLVTTIHTQCGNLTATYTIHYTYAEEQSADLIDLRVNGETIANFNPFVTNYFVTLWEGNTPQIEAIPQSSAATVNVNLSEDLTNATITVVCGTLNNTYTILFNYIVMNAQLSDLQVNNATIQGFSPTILQYTYPLDTVNLPVISATSMSPYAIVEITQPTLETPVGTVIVTCGDSILTYTIYFGASDKIHQVVKEDFTVYPNPVTHQVNIQLQPNSCVTEVIIYNTTGQAIIKKHITNNDIITLDLNHIPSGFYFLYLQSDQTIIGTTKLIKR